MEEILGILGGILAVALLVVFYRLAKMNNAIGLLFRTGWNISFHIISLIPLFGWASHFVITVDEDK